MTDIAVSLSCVIDGKSKAFILENVNDTDINESSVVTRHPIPNGEYVSDSMYKSPGTLSLSGTFSMIGNQGLVVSDEGRVSLIDIQKLFKRIKDEGILCNIVKVKVSENNNPRFMIRKNLALQSIRWKERINTLDFTFDFIEVFQVDVNEYSEVDMTDEYLPDIEEPKMLNFTDSLFDPATLMQTMDDVLISNDLLDTELRDWFKGLGSVAVNAVLGGLIAATAIALIVSTPKIILIGAVVVAGIIMLGRIISDVVRASKSKVKPFRKYLRDKKNEKELKRYAALFDDMLKSFESLNQQIVVYQISANKAHQAILNIDDEYYCFTFTKNIDGSYGMTISLLNDGMDSSAPGSKSITSIKNQALNSLGDCNRNTAVLLTNNGYQVYLINTSENRTNALTECYLLISNIDMTNFSKLINDLVVAYLLT